MHFRVKIYIFYCYSMWNIELPLCFKRLMFNLAIGRNDFCCRTLEISVCWPESPNLTSTLPSSGILPPASLMDMLCSVASCWTRTKLDTHNKATGSDSVLRIIQERRLQMANSFQYTQENTSDIHYSARTSLFLSCSDLFLPTCCRCRGLLLHLITLNDTHHSR